MIGYAIGISGQSLVFTDEVLTRFQRYQQINLWDREAGGQLFTRVENQRLVVVEATGPRPTDRRRRSSYHPDRKAEQQEIYERFPRGLHFVGDWHTHPEDRPRPSPLDLQSTADGVRRSHHSLNGFVLVIVGRGAFPTALYVAVNDGTTQYVLEPEKPVPLDTEGEPTMGL